MSLKKKEEENVKMNIRFWPFFHVIYFVFSTGYDLIYMVFTW